MYSDICYLQNIGTMYLYDVFFFPTFQVFHQPEGIAGMRPQRQREVCFLQYIMKKLIAFLFLITN